MNILSNNTIRISKIEKVLVFLTAFALSVASIFVMATSADASIESLGKVGQKAATIAETQAANNLAQTQFNECNNLVLQMPNLDFPKAMEISTGSTATETLCNFSSPKGVPDVLKTLLKKVPDSFSIFGLPKDGLPAKVLEVVGTTDDFGNKTFMIPKK